ncbi:RDD family protein [Streptomyces sp. B6B3]|uniref:RDD family protein n=1 Tax=Streptomyces sp. B6B3 TaxID=3153570 RepID=UPI00325E000C
MSHFDARQASVSDRQALPPWLPSEYRPGRETPADLNDRFVPLMIDAVIFGVLAFALASLNEMVGGPPAVAVVLGAALLLCYSPVCTARWGGTPAKLLRDMRVADADDGTNLSYRRALGRHLAHWALVVPAGLSHLWILWDEPLQQCLHDKAARTLVVIRE